MDAGDASVLTVGMFRGGNRGNIIPDRATMEGTLRTFDEKRREYMMRRVKEVAEGVAKAMDGSAEVVWGQSGYATTVNDPALTERMAPSLARVTGPDRLRLNPRATGAEDFSFLAQRAPGLFFFVGVTPQGVDPR
ncbi:MAG: peptidase dimerization domain-containing protein, partial [Acetobacteraceae bacterium]|nr:peptidase dimerization domain-containing protein [Acetobacteraceae bacterium]